MEHEPKQETELERIHLADYRKLDVSLNEWLHTPETLPEEFFQELKILEHTLTLREVIEIIQEKLLKIFGGKLVKPETFAESRFTSLPELFEKHIWTCGSKANLFGTALRQLGIPVRFVHAWTRGQSKKSSNRHAWLDVWDPHASDWIEIDPGERSLQVNSEFERLKVYHDWHELKSDWEAGDY